MSTDATSADKPVSSVGNNVTPNSPLPAVKGKEKVENVAAEAEDDEDSDEEMDEEDEDEDDEDEYEELDPRDILSSGRRTRGIKVDYTSPEALSKAGLKPEDEGEEEGEDSFAHDEDPMGH